MTQSFPPTLIIRHRLENLKKCSLLGLNAPHLIFLSYPYKQLPPLHGYLLLAVDAPPLTQEDAAYGLLLLDATWRYTDKMTRAIEAEFQGPRRSLPGHFRTAYPRKQTGCPDPERGLASIEALYLSYLLLGRSTEGLLDHYYWKDCFLTINNLNI